MGNLLFPPSFRVNTMQSQDEEYLKDLYYNPKHRTAFSSADKLWKYLKLHGKSITRKQLKDWLSKQDTYTSHHPIRHKFPTRQVVTSGINDLWDVDLMDVSNLADTNDGVHFILIIIDVFSRYLYVEPMPNKSVPETLKAFKTILRRSGQQPDTFRSDAGKEFLGKEMKDYLAEREIYQQITRNDKKANYAERVIQTLKKKMYRYMYHKIGLRYIDVLQDLVAGYNDNYHSSIQCAPSAVTKENEIELWAQQYLPEPTGKVKKIHYNFSVGDLVRISNLRHPFSKGYGQTFSEELFKIQYRYGTYPATYRLIDLHDKNIAGLFYEPEMTLVKGKDPTSDKTVYRIEEILGERRRKGKKEYHIKWKGYPKSFNSWIPEANLV